MPTLDGGGTLDGTPSPGGASDGFAIERDGFEADGTQTEFTLSYSCATDRRKGSIVSRGGLLQRWHASPSTASQFNVNGTTLTFGVAPLAGQWVEIIYWIEA